MFQIQAQVERATFELLQEQDDLVCTVVVCLLWNSSLLGL